MKENNTVIHMLAQLVSSFEGLSDPRGHAVLTSNSHRDKRDLF